STGHGIVQIIDADGIAPSETNELNDAAFDLGTFENSTYFSNWEGLTIQIQEDQLSAYLIEVDDRNPQLLTDPVFRVPVKKSFRLDWTIPNISNVVITQFWWGQDIYAESNHSESAIQTGDIFYSNVMINITGLWYGVIYALEEGGAVLMSERVVMHVAQETTSILFVDDDGAENYENYFEDALQAHGYNSYLVWEINSRGSPPGLFLQLFPVVIWGIVWPAFPTLSLTDRENIASYLNSGGNLFISGQDIGWDLDDQGENQWLADYLKAGFLSDDSESSQLYGINEDPISDGFSFIITPPIGSYILYPSVINPLQGAQTIFRYQNGQIAGLSYNGSYSLVYLAFGFPAITSSSTRISLMERVLNWLEGPVSVNIASPSPNTFLDEPTALVVNAHAYSGIKNVSFRIGEGEWNDITERFNGSHYLTNIYPQNFTDSPLLQVRVGSNNLEYITAQIPISSPYIQEFFKPILIILGLIFLILFYNNKWIKES
ncbi:MAG: hypothetical protein ACFFDT_10860, partial [Candidatus Hodarchaeota archaeon]